MSATALYITFPLFAVDAGREPAFANVASAARAAGCLDVAITADLIDPGRVGIFERWSRGR